MCYISYMNKNNLIIVNINDIEDIVLAKYKIDQADPNIDGRSDLNNFMSEYCSITDIAIINGDIKPFKYVSKFGMNFLFISNSEDADYIIELLEKCNYDINTLKEVHLTKMMEPDYLKNNVMLIRNNKYYNV